MQQSIWEWKYLYKAFALPPISALASIIFESMLSVQSIAATYDVEESNISDICNVVGIDRGINFVVATYDSKHKSGFVSGKTIKQKRANYSKLRKKLQMRQTPSSRRRLKAIGQRENRWMQDVNHCVSKALVENNPKHTLFVLEDLSGIRNVTERVRIKDTILFQQIFLKPNLLFFYS